MYADTCVTYVHLGSTRVDGLSTGANANIYKNDDNFHLPPLKYCLMVSESS
jgi:hypothetical protein